MAGQAADLLHQEGERAPARRAHAVAELVDPVLGHRSPLVRQPRHPLDLPLRQRERLAEVADRPPGAVGGEGGHQRGVLGPVPVDDVEHQPLAHVAGEVEVDVGHAREVSREEPAQEEMRGHRVDVREADQIADDRADARAPPAARREQAAAGARPAHPHRHVARHLEDVAVEEEEAGEAMVGDQPQLLIEPRAGLVPVGGAPIAALELGPADAREGGLGGLARVGEVGVGVAQVLRQVEAAAVGHGRRRPHRLGGEPGRGLGGGAQHRLVVSAPLGLAPLEGGAHADRDERVLEEGAPGRVGVHVAGRHRRQAQPVRQLPEEPVSARVAAHVGAHDLDREPIAPEGVAQPPSQRLGLSEPALGDEPRDRAVSCAAREAVQAVRVPNHLLERRLGLSAVVDVGGGDEPAQVGVAAPVLAQQGQVRASLEGDLAARDRPHADLVGRMGEGQRSREAVVVGQGESVVAERRRPGRQLIGLGGAVQERERGVGVKLGVAHLAPNVCSIGSSAYPLADQRASSAGGR